MKTNWRQPFSVITYLAGGAEIYRLYTPLLAKFIFGTITRHIGFSQRGFHYGQTAPRWTPKDFQQNSQRENLVRTLADALFTFIFAAARSVCLAKEGHDLSGSSKHLSRG